MGASEDLVTAQDVVRRWRAAAESGDADAAAACLTDDVVLVSPLSDRATFRGREQLRELLAAAFVPIRGIRFHTEVGEGDTRALFSTASVHGEPLEEAQLLRLDVDGRIREVTLFMRPLPGLTAAMAGLGPELARRRGLARTARLLAVATAPLHAMARFGDRRLVPLVDRRPRRRGGPTGAGATG